MRRTYLALAAVLSAGALAAPAAGDAGDGAGPAARGQGGEDLEIRFQLRQRDGDPVALRRFRFTGLEIVCNGGVERTTGGRIRRIPVRDDNTFRIRRNRDGKVIAVRGRVSGNLERVVGELRVRGRVGTATGCDSEFVRFTAE